MSKQCLNYGQLFRSEKLFRRSSVASLVFTQRIFCHLFIKERVKIPIDEIIIGQILLPGIRSGEDAKDCF